MAFGKPQGGLLQGTLFLLFPQKAGNQKTKPQSIVFVTDDGIALHVRALLLGWVGCHQFVELDNSGGYMIFLSFSVRLLEMTPGFETCPRVEKSA